MRRPLGVVRVEGVRHMVTCPGQGCSVKCGTNGIAEGRGCLPRVRDLPTSARRPAQLSKCVGGTISHARTIRSLRWACREGGRRAERQGGLGTTPHKLGCSGLCGGVCTPLLSLWAVSVSVCVSV